MSEIITRYIHFIGIFTLAGTLISEHLLLRKELSRAEIGRISRIDAVYGIAAMVVIGAGLTLWFGGVGKPSVYYSKNWVFHTKVTCVAIIALLSIYPTVFFLKNRKGDPNELIKIPGIIFTLIRISLVILFAVPLLAALMARGVGFFG